MNARKMQTGNLALLAAATLVVAACGGSGSQPMTSSTAPMNRAPVISAIVDKSLDQDSTLNIDFTVQDQETAADALQVTAVPNDAKVFPADGLLLTGTGTTRTLSLTPLEAATGNTAISILVTDADGGFATRTFNVAVNAKTVSMRDSTTDTFAKGESDSATSLNGVTFQQDADDPAVFAALVTQGAE